jgi:anti-sigma B factor antagonist
MANPITPPEGFVAQPAPAAGPQVSTVVVALPAEIDIANADQVEAQLTAACAPGVTVIADLSATEFCDSSGARALLTAHQRAAAAGGELRAAIPAAAVRRAMSLLALDTILNIYPGLAEALAGGPAGS